jgi:hypothetical protein
MNEESLYEVLGISESSSTEEITEAYRRLVRLTHPDAGGNSFLFVGFTRPMRSFLTPRSVPPTTEIDCVLRNTPNISMVRGAPVGLVSTILLEGGRVPRRRTTTSQPRMTGQPGKAMLLNRQPRVLLGLADSDFLPRGRGSWC